jgi:hypothetical protein
MFNADTHYNPTDPRVGNGGQTYYVAADQGEMKRIEQARVYSDDLTPSDVVRMMRPVALPQVALFPPRTGYGHHVVDIEDCLDADRPDMQRYDFSGSPAGYSGTSTPSGGVW